MKTKLKFENNVPLNRK